MIEVVVQAISLASVSSRLFELRPVSGSLPPFEPGAHVGVRLGPGLLREYSLCNDPGERHRYLICVKRDPHSRGGSAHLHESVTVGDHLEISPPHNDFALDLTASRHLLIGGGIGVTPLMAMAHTLLEADAAFELHHYSSRPADSPLFETLTSGPLADRYFAHHSSEGDSARNFVPAPVLSLDPGAAIYICGPLGLDARLTEEALGAGWDPSQIRRERFTAPPASPPADEDGVFFVNLARSGLRLLVPPNRTIAEVLLEHGVEVTMSCEQGICGACLTTVLAGTPDHRDEIQDPEERAANTQLTVCCSRARGPELTLDL